MYNPRRTLRSHPRSAHRAKLLGRDLGRQAQCHLGIVDGKGALAASDEFRHLCPAGTGDTTRGHTDIFSP